MIAVRLGTSRRILPLGRDEAARFLPWVLAVLVYLAGIGCCGFIVLDGAMRASADDLLTRVTLQVPAEASDARLQTVLALLRQTPGIRSVHLLAPTETARLLEPWLGPGVKFDELPVPRLIDMRTDPGQHVDIPTLRQHLASVVPNSRLEDHGQALAARRAAARPIRGVLAAGIAVAFVVIAVSSVFATRTALTANRATVELVHLLGAADRDVVRRFALRTLWQSLLAGVIGGAAVMLTAAALANGIDRPPSAATSGAGDWRLWAVVAAVIAATGFVATVSAWATVRCRLARMP